jgi:malate dehydrogenase (oxaloacetate-decarboxylating)(NADP+)
VSQKLSDAESLLRDAALEYHRSPTRGKISVTPTKPLSNQRDLSLAYSPGVAYACLAIQESPALAADYTSRANLVGVITNGTAVLGLGDIGPLAGKPVMEGKGCLFKKFAGIDVFDIELAEHDPDKLVDIVAALEPTLGGVNLEDIKAPECFYIEKKLRERMNIPVFHDDQHGTAIISAAALLNGLELVGKKLGEVKLAVSGAGAAAIACLDVMVGLGVKRENIYVCDSKGVIREGREDFKAGKLDESKQRYCQRTEARTLADIVKGADVFLGCSAAGVMSVEMVMSMARQPIILALANPEPEIRPELAKAARPDCIIATGRSDYPNQVNNVLCFPYIFRGALDCGATKITEAMKLACVREIAALAKAETSDEVAAAYQGKELKFGPEYIIPTPFDVRLILRIAPAVAKAAAESGVATRPIADLDAYRQGLSRFVYQTGMFMRPVFAAAKQRPARVVYAEGEDERVLRAVQVVLDEGLAKPILVGRPEVVKMRIERAGLRLSAGRDFELCDPENDPRFREYWETYRGLMAREGVTPEAAKAAVRRSNTLISSIMLKRGEADAMLCGLVGRYDAHLDHVRHVIGRRAGARTLAAMNALMLEQHTLFITDTFVNEEPSAEELADIALMAAAEVRRFGVPPKLAFLSHSVFGSSARASALRMRQAHALFRERAPADIESDGEMQGDAALSETVRRGYLPESTLSGSANLLVLPNLDAANILFNVLKMTGGHGVTVGPILLGAARPAHILTPSATVRRIVNMTALAVADAAELAAA